MYLRYGNHLGITYCVYDNITIISIIEFDSYIKRGKIAIYLRSDVGRNLPVTRSHSVYDDITIILILEFNSYIEHEQIRFFYVRTFVVICL